MNEKFKVIHYGILKRFHIQDNYINQCKETVKKIKLNIIEDYINLISSAKLMDI